MRKNRVDICSDECVNYRIIALTFVFSVKKTFSAHFNTCEWDAEGYDTCRASCHPLRFFLLCADTLTKQKGLILQRHKSYSSLVSHGQAYLSIYSSCSGNVRTQEGEPQSLSNCCSDLELKGTRGSPTGRSVVHLWWKVMGQCCWQSCADLMSMGQDGRDRRREISGWSRATFH